MNPKRLYPRNLSRKAMIFRIVKVLGHFLELGKQIFNNVTRNCIANIEKPINEDENIHCLRLMPIP